MTATEFTPLQSLAGGAMIGLAASLLMLTLGRVAGIMGILTGVLLPNAKDWQWRAAFLAGMLASPLLYVVLTGQTFRFETITSKPLLLVSGLVVGVGVAFGNGCTSGHGVCGLARFSLRSLAATLAFMASTAVTVFVVRHVIGA